LQENSQARLELPGMFWGEYGGIRQRQLYVQIRAAAYDLHDCNN